MSPTATKETTIVPEGDDDAQVQKWLKELERAEQLMDELEAKTDRLDAKMDALLHSLNQENDQDMTNDKMEITPTSPHQDSRQ
ncbi:uncharacterized protein BX664DRAFT_331166 [Halteromyces radiatus]|uniref:uncharacterized protein n=1 Tax=Halteromyces radiatus TaxID=101107 RepID=UPI00221F4669|nr:uncharacterized protein BX664DRAFT_331166 [Halteromyces radiatus]KAI8088702.1 hypothetical protein BX664DRAFT_331166 [Halteromyces radiatus]